MGVYYNDIGVIYDKSRVVYDIPDWYTVNGNTVRYYPLNDTTDYSPYNATLTNSGVTFDKGYAEFVVDASANMLQDKTFNFSQLTANYTIFSWEKLYTGSTTFQYNWYIDGVGSEYQILDHRNNNDTRLRTWVTSGQDVIDTTSITPDTWFWTCAVQYFGSYRALWVGDENGITWTGRTESPNADAISSFDTITFGNDINNSRTNGRNGAISGVIIEKIRWFEADILTQVAKGPQFNYTGW